MSFLQQYDGAGDAEKLKLLYQWIATQPLALFAELRENRPIFVTPGGPVLVTRFADVEEALSRNMVFTVRPYAPKMDPSVGPFMLARDGTVYNQRDKGIMRALIQQADMPGVRKTVAGLARAAIQQGAADGRLEVVSQLSRRVPVLLTGEYFGFPGPDVATMMGWSYATQYDMFHNPTSDEAVHEASVRAGREMKEYLGRFLPDQLERLRHDPTLDDVVSRLLKTTFPASIGFDMSRIMTNTMGLLVGGVETTSAAIVQAIDQLLDRPDELAAAVRAANDGDDQEFDKYFWEALRFNPMNPFVVRLCVADYTLATGTDRETLIKAGSVVFASNASAMHDATELKSPETFDIDRPDYHYMHMGYGSHVCLGDQVSWVQAPEIARQLLSKPGFRRAPGDAGKIDFKGGPFPESFTVEFD